MKPRTECVRSAFPQYARPGKLCVQQGNRVGNGLPWRSAPRDGWGGTGIKARRARWLRPKVMPPRAPWLRRLKGVV